MLVGTEIALDLYITANSPGEIFGWVVPALREIRCRIWQCRTTLVILPCQYASGEELSLGERTGADRIVPLKSLGTLLKNPDEKKYTVKKRLVLHLGGDIMFSVYISKRISAPLWVYASRPRWRRFVNRYFVPDKESLDRFIAYRVPSDMLCLIGNIALDSVTLREAEDETREFLGLRQDEPVLCCLSGSRPIEYMESMPLFFSICRQLVNKFPTLRVLFPLAPTVREKNLRDALSSARIEWRGESLVREISLGRGIWGMVVRDMTLEALNCAKLALAVPGTNNLQAAALYIPYIMLLPLEKADEYPIEGILGILPLWLPGVRALKRAIIGRMNDRTSFISLPNRMAGRMIAPEVRGRFDPQVVVRLASGLLESPKKLREMSRAFWDLTHERGASSRLAEQVEGYAKYSR